MPTLITVPCFTDERGCLSVIDGLLPFPIRRVFYLHGAEPGAVRAGHRHRKNRQALICVNGSCAVHVHDGERERDFILDSPGKGLILEPSDWHTVRPVGRDTVLLVLASEAYDAADYIREPYP